ncbi:unnamed protein product, partial [Rotaria sp. Silwood1]
QTHDNTLPRLSFDQKLTAHRSNRLNETFGQINFPFQFQSNKKVRTNDDILIPLRCKTPSNNGRIHIYENSCHMLDIAIDWQLHSLLSHDNIAVHNRSFSFNEIRAFATAIEANLESLILSSIDLIASSIRILCQGLRKCVNLNLLDLSCNKLSRESFKLLVDTINYCTSLNYLSLANCGIQDSYGRSIGNLCRHKRLIEINLSGNEFEDMACILIGGALTENIRLIDLNLSWNFIRSYASIALFRGFEINKTLTEFDISWSNLGYDGSVALRRVLIVNQFLHRLNISNCNIDRASAKLISEGLEKNSTLQRINLSFNPLTTHGVHDIVQALNHKKITKTDSMRKIIEHIDARHWRTLDYFRILNNQKQLQVQNETMPHKILKSDIESETDKVEKLQRYLTDRIVQPFTYKNLNYVINQQRIRDRLQKVRQEKQEKDMKNRNKKILQTVNEYFPDINIISKQEKHRETIEQLAKPRIFSTNEKP